MSRLLTKEMRVATREIHNISDALVNAKLAFGKKCCENFHCFQ